MKTIHILVLLKQVDFYQAAARCAVKAPDKMEKEIGKVIHYYGKAGVVVLRLSDSLSLGETIKIKKGESEFTETVNSMQIDYKNVESVKAGDEVAIKVSQGTKEGAIVYKIEA